MTINWNYVGGARQDTNDLRSRVSPHICSLPIPSTNHEQIINSNYPNHPTRPRYVVAFQHDLRLQNNALEAIMGLPTHV